MQDQKDRGPTKGLGNQGGTKGPRELWTKGAGDQGTWRQTIDFALVYSFS